MGPKASSTAARLGDHRIRIHDPAIGPRLVLAPNRGDVGGAVPLSVVAGGLDRGWRPPAIGGVEGAIGAALDTTRFFGHIPGVHVTSMPDLDSRRRWWALLPE